MRFSAHFDSFHAGGRHLIFCRLLAVLLTSAVGAACLLAASTEGMVLYVCDSSADRVVALSDRDGSGSVEMDVLGEIRVFYDDSSAGPDLSTPSHLASGEDGNVYLLDGGTLDAVLVLADKNGDGDANDAGEVSTFYDASAGGLALSTPNALVPAPDGAFYVSDDGSKGHRVLWLKDIDGDGEALDLDESRVVYDASAFSSPLLEDIEALAVTPEGHLYAGEATLQSIFLLKDVDGDGGFFTEGEAVPYFQGSLDLPVGDVEALLVVDGVLYSCDKTAGLILRLEDKNGDGDAADEEESSVFLDGTASVGSITDLCALPGGGFLVLDNSKDAVLTVQDLNADGDALDEGEAVRWLVDDGTTFATPSGLVLLPRGEDPPPQDEFLRGDATGDGFLDLSDPVRTLGYLFLGTVVTECHDAMDADDSGDISISDAIFSLHHLFLGGAPPPPPFPLPGIDPTPDEIDC